jgi:hypothetical protein
VCYQVCACDAAVVGTQQQARSRCTADGLLSSSGLALPNADGSSYRRHNPGDQVCELLCQIPLHLTVPGSGSNRNLVDRVICIGVAVAADTCGGPGVMYEGSGYGAQQLVDSMKLQEDAALTAPRSAAADCGSSPSSCSSSVQACCGGHQELQAATCSHSRSKRLKWRRQTRQRDCTARSR